MVGYAIVLLLTAAVCGVVAVLIYNSLRPHDPKNMLVNKVEE